MKKDSLVQPLDHGSSIFNPLFEALLVAFVVLSIYLSLLHLNIAHAHDAPDYYNRVITENPAWHAHHVLYEPVLWLWLEYTKYIVPSLHPFMLASAMNSFFGAGCILFVHLIARNRLGFSSLHAVITSFTIAGSFYMLNYATTVEVYHSALFFALWTFYLATSSKEFTYRDMIVIGIIHGIAMGFHQMHVLLGVVFLSRFLQAGIRKFTAYILSGTVVVVSVYGLAVYAEGISSVSEFTKYFMGYMGNEQIIQNSSSPILAPFGLGMALLGGRYIMSIEPFKSIITNQFTDSMFERLLILHHKTSPLSGAIQLSLYGIFILIAGYVLWFYARRITKKDIRKYKESYLFILIYSLFFTFWYPHNPEFWGASLIFMLLVIFQKVTNLRILVVLSLCIIAINILGSAIPLLDPDNNLYPDGIQTLF